MKRRWFSGKLASYFLVAFMATTFTSTAYATGESYQYKDGSLYGSGPSSNFFHIFGLDEVRFTSLQNQNYSPDSGMEVFYIERAPDHLAQQCGAGSGAYVEVHVDKNTKKTTFVKAACGTQSEQGNKNIFDNDYSGYNTWDQNVNIQWSASPPTPVGPVDIGGTPSYEFNTEKSKTGTAIKACGGFYKQFNNSGCVEFSQISSSDNSAATSIVGSGDSYYYSADQSAGSCSLTLQLAISSTNRSLSGGSLSGYAGYRLIQGGVDVTSSNADCTLVKPSDSASWESKPGVAITISKAGELESFLNGPVEVAESAPTCTIPGVGWIVCPVVNFLASIADDIHNFLNEFLEVPAKPIFDQNGDTYKAWSVMRNYANILFIIGFIIIVLSQVTSLGISNYGIKKLLPKLIIVAVLVNLSFPITAILVDLSNIFGYRLSEAVTSLTPKDLQETELKGDLFANGNTFGAIAASILGATALAAGIYFFLATLIGILISVVVTGVVVVLLLTIRQAVIIMLIVAAPIAFATMLLPNTEGIYKKWMLIFKSLLLVFPIIGLLYGSAKLASSILMSVGNETGNTLLTLIAAALPILVTVTVVSILKKVLDIIDGGANLATRLQGGLNKIGGVTSGIAKRDKRNRQYAAQGARMNVGKLGRFGKWAAYGGARKDQAVKFRESEANRQAIGMYAEKVGEKNGKNWYTRRMTGGDPASANAALANAVSIDAKLETDQVNAAKAVIESFNLTSAELKNIAMGGTDSEHRLSGADDITRRAAIQSVLKKSTVGDTEDIIKTSGNMTDSARQDLVNELVSTGMVQKATHLGGATLDKIAQGKVTTEADLDNAAMSHMNKGKYSAEVQVNQDGVSMERVARLAQSGASPDGTLLDSTIKAKMKAAAIQVEKDPRLKARINSALSGESIHKISII